MRRVVDGDAVEEDQVLIRGAAADIECTGEIVGGLDTGQHLQRTHNIGFDKSRCRVNFLDIELDLATLHGFFQLRIQGLNRDPFGLQNIFNKSDIDS